LFGLNTALAGIRQATRRLEIMLDGKRRIFTLPDARDFAREVTQRPPVTVSRQGNLAIISFANSLGNNATIAEFNKAIMQVMDAPFLLLDLRNTPSGGNTTVARGVMGHFTTQERAYQMHTIPYDERVNGVKRKFVEYVAPLSSAYTGQVFVAGGRWTASMGEGLMIGFDALGATTIGSELGHLLGALHNLTIKASNARIDFGVEALFHINGTPREQYRPSIYLPHTETTSKGDPVLQYFLSLSTAKTN
jgi:carboxyl-terminal processing protease